MALPPSSGGIFEILLDGEIIATSRDTKRMSEPNEVKCLERDAVAPDRTIGREPT